MRQRWWRSRSRRPDGRRTRVLVAVSAAAVVVVVGLAVQGDGLGVVVQGLADRIAGGAGMVREALSAEEHGVMVSGPARVVDGDTLEVRGTRVRLHGIDAPESAQGCRRGGRTWLCGRGAGRALARRIGSRAVACEVRDRDRYGRVVAVCRVGDEDVNAWMVLEGWAFAYRRYSMRYAGEELAARIGKRGIWSGDVVAPWDWRGGKRLEGAGVVGERGGRECAIKGNIGRDGSRICHVPGGRFCARTRIDDSAGERWFCSEAEAQVAGWRRSDR